MTDGTYVLYGPRHRPPLDQEESAVRIACLCIPHLPATVALRRQPQQRARPVLIADYFTGSPRIVDALPAAAGVVPDMLLSAALARFPDATVLTADMPACRHLFRRICAALQGVGDRVEAAEPGTAYVGLDGLAGLHGGEGCAPARPAGDSVPERPRALRIGVAAGKFPAWVAARSADGREARHGPGRRCGRLPRAPLR